jgi:predicted Zn-dependent peptidase
MRSRPRYVVAALCAAVLCAAPALALDIDEFEKNLTVEKLDNGLTLLIYERPVAPVVSFFTHVNVGSAQEVPGITGLAHMFEHMAFKGTTKVGTKDYKAEKKALDAADAAYAALAAERSRVGGADPAKLAALEEAFKSADEAATAFVEPNEFDDIVSRAGGVGMNAFTNADTTGYFFSMPANKLELWAYLESERFRDPVFREYYKERDVVMEERRMRTESQPIGRMIEQVLAAAYTAHPYGQPTVGYMSDLQSITRPDAEAFHHKYYVPSNITIAIVGDIDTEKSLPMLRKYFGRIPAGTAPEPLRTVEPVQIAERTIVLQDPSQPVYAEAYHRPAAGHPDDAVYDALSDILSNGRTSRLYRRLVRDEQIAAFAGAFNGFPGTKYPSLMLFFGIATPQGSNEAIQAAVREEIEKLKSEPVGDDELAAVKTRAKANLIRGLADNSGIAGQLAMVQGQTGDWKEIFRQVERIEKVTKDDIMRVASETFTRSNRTVAMIETDAETAAK